MYNVQNQIVLVGIFSLHCSTGSRYCSVIFHKVRFNCAMCNVNVNMGTLVKLRVSGFTQSSREEANAKLMVEALVLQASHININNSLSLKLLFAFC